MSSFAQLITYFYHVTQTVFKRVFANREKKQLTTEIHQDFIHFTTQHNNTVTGMKTAVYTSQTTA